MTITFFCHNIFQILQLLLLIDLLYNNGFFLPFSLTHFLLRIEEKYSCYVVVKWKIGKMAFAPSSETPKGQDVKGVQESEHLNTLPGMTVFPEKVLEIVPEKRVLEWNPFPACLLDRVQWRMSTGSGRGGRTAGFLAPKRGGIRTV